MSTLAAVYEALQGTATGGINVGIYISPWTGIEWDNLTKTQTHSANDPL